MSIEKGIIGHIHIYCSKGYIKSWTPNGSIKNNISGQLVKSSNCKSTLFVPLGCVSTRRVDSLLQERKIGPVIELSPAKGVVVRQGSSIDQFLKFYSNKSNCYNSHTATILNNVFYCSLPTKQIIVHILDHWILTIAPRITLYYINCLTQCSSHNIFPHKICFQDVCRQSNSQWLIKIKYCYLNIHIIWPCSSWINNLNHNFLIIWLSIKINRFW